MALSRLLVLRALGLGDLLTGVPALRALRAGFPHHRIVLAAPGPLEPLAALSDAVDQVLDTTGLDFLRWSGPAPEIAVNLHGKGPRSHRLLQALRPGRLAAFGCAEARHEGPRWRAEEHEVRRWCRLVDEALGLRAAPSDLRLRRPQLDPPAPGAVVVHPGAAFESRRWPADRFATVARALADAGHRVVVTGGADETGLAAQVCALAGLAPSASLAGRTPLAALAAQVAGASLLVCGDTGVAHLATAYGTPSVVLFGPVPPTEWGPPPTGPHLVLWKGDPVRRGDPWGNQADPRLLDIGVAQVLEAARAALAVSPGRRTSPASA